MKVNTSIVRVTYGDYRDGCGCGFDHFNLISVNNQNGVHFMISCAKNEFEVVKKYLESGLPYYYYCDRFGNTPLIMASKCGNIEIIKLLLDYDSKHVLNHRNCFGETALIAAKNYDNFDVVELLKKY